MVGLITQPKNKLIIASISEVRVSSSSMMSIFSFIHLGSRSIDDGTTGRLECFSHHLLLLVVLVTVFIGGMSVGRLRPLLHLLHGSGRFLGVADLQRNKYIEAGNWKTK